MTDAPLGWNLFAAAMTSNPELRATLISSVHKRVFYNVSAGVFPTSYDPSLGTTISGVAR
jgi:hypothetical protein